jgi:hypothetical protein
MQKLFRSFERFGVEYLLISGQASVLYGAATFSEDVDVWIRPSVANARRLLRALAAGRGRVYKLTPPMTLANMRFGHGFHFTLPRGDDTLYLDVMAAPPRVGSFVDARRRANVMQGPLGPVPVVSVPDLVELKKTQRFLDYDVISNLAAATARNPAADTRLLAWAARNSFRPQERASFLARLGRRASMTECHKEILADVGRLQAKDTAYWRRIVQDLRRLRRDGRLLETGTPVARIVEGKRPGGRGDAERESSARISPHRDRRPELHATARHATAPVPAVRTEPRASRPSCGTSSQSGVRRNRGPGDAR